MKYGLMTLRRLSLDSARLCSSKKGDFLFLNAVFQCIVLISPIINDFLDFFRLFDIFTIRDSLG